MNYNNNHHIKKTMITANHSDAAVWPNRCKPMMLNQPDCP